MKQTMAFGPRPPKWLGEGFHTHGDSRHMVIHEWEGHHTCTDENDSFPKTTCLDKNNKNFQRRVYLRCMMCQRAGGGVWFTYFCSKASDENDLLKYQYVEYADPLCQHVNSYDFSDQVKKVTVNPHCFRGGFYGDVERWKYSEDVDCKAECRGNPPTRYNRTGCHHTYSKDEAACKQDSLCTWTEPPMDIRFNSVYFTFEGRTVMVV